MRKEYDFSKMKAAKNPYASKLKAEKVARDKTVKKILTIIDKDGGQHLHPQAVMIDLFSSVLTQKQLDNYLKKIKNLKK